MKIDLKSTIDIESSLRAGQANKVLKQILNQGESHYIVFSKHCRKEMSDDNLTSVDIINVLQGGRIIDDPELEKGTYRYRVETPNIIVVIAFCKPHMIRCVTAWRKK
ncbi:MAG: DUF4258 domain-containing protein [Deltaproteobacteria bacterium]|nr:DUF4258 domain-containing protein [Deltaproteobacteria bacterium]